MLKRTLWLVGLYLLAASQAHAAYSALYVFGDSLSDTGNNYIGLSGATTSPPYVDATLPGAPLIPIPPYASQRYSDDLVWADYFAAALGLTATPSLAGGTNYAFGGARSGPLSNIPDDGIIDAPTVREQVGFATANGTLSLPSDALYVVWAGGNDVRDAGVVLAGGGNANAVIGEGVANMVTAISALGAAGARHFLIPNVPDVGVTPIANWLDANVNPFSGLALTTLSANYNSALAAQLPGLAAGLGADFITLDIFAFLQDSVANPLPGANVVDACTSGNAFTGCSDPQLYLFWDAMHPTTVAHEAIAGLAVATVVPLPAAMPLFACALALLLRRHARAA